MRSCLCLAIAALPSLALAELPSKEGLLAAWESNWTPINDLSITWETQCDVPGAIPVYTSLLRTNGLQYFIRMERFHQGAAILEEVSFDPSSGLGHCLNDGPAAARPLGWITSLDTPGGNRAQHFGEFMTRMLRPLEVTNGWERHSLSNMLADPASQLRSELETIDGRAAAVLDVTIGGALAATVWMDVERNAVPLKWCDYRLDDGAVIGTHELLDYQDFNGAFLPLRIETAWGPSSASGAATSVLQVSGGPKGPMLLVNSELTSEDCTVTFPPGTYVMNEVNSETSIVRGDGRALEAAYASTRAAADPGTLSMIALGLTAALSLLSGVGLRFAVTRG